MVNVGIFINTPAQLHFYKNIAKRLLDNNNCLMVMLRDYGETVQLAKELGLSVTLFSKNSKKVIEKIFSTPQDIFVAAKQLKKIRPNLVTGFGFYDTYVSMIIGSKNIVFSDTEPRLHRLLKLQYRMFMPLADAIVTPSCFLDCFGNKHIKINSYKELAYLHPKYYKPDERIFELIGLNKGEDYAVLRFNAFDAVHDINISGFSNIQKIKLIKTLEKHMRVFVSAEGKVPREIERYVLKIPKRRIHDLLYYAKLFVTDTGTMATEAAILGTPTIRASPISLKKELGNFIELDRKYGLLLNINDTEAAIREANRLLGHNDLKKVWLERRNRLLNDKIDITSFMAWFIEKYPESLKEIKEKPEKQYLFK